MFYKKCDKCTNKTCEKTKKICKSMDAWLKEYVEVAQQHKVVDKGELEWYDYLTQGITDEWDT